MQRTNENKRMNIVVCCKAVPGLVTDLKIGGDGKAIQYQAQLLAINECDEYALEEALALKRTHGGQVTAISMGNIKTLDILYYALAKGADKALRIDSDSQDPLVEYRYSSGSAKARLRSGADW